MPDEAPGNPTSGTAAGSDIFVSYASQDAAVADTIVDALERQGLKCWIAPRDVVPGAAYADGIVRAINGARVFVLVLSSHAVASPHVSRELERAASKRRPIVALRNDNAALTPAFEYFLSEPQWIDVGSSGLELAVEKLVAAVRRHLDPTGLTPTPVRTATADAHGAAAIARSRWIVAAGASVLLLALAYSVVDKFWLPKRTTQTQPTAVARSDTPAISEKSVAVLPFVDMSEKKDQEYFSDGMAEEIIDQLVKVPGLRVPARTSSFYFKGKSADIPTIAKRLMVAHVLEGSVRRSGDRLRITAQLVRADSGYHLWSATYNRMVDDIFKVQDEIAHAVVNELKVSLLTNESPRATPTTSTGAYTLYLQARAIALRASQTDYETAIALLRRALKLDPTFAAAWAELANEIVDKSFWAQSGRAADIREETHRAATRAIELDQNLSDGHLAMAKVLRYLDWNWDAADGEFQKALTLNAGNADALRQRSYLAGSQGHVDLGLQLAQNAVVRDPLNSWNFHALAGALIAKGRLADAEANDRIALELNPTGAGLHSALGLTLVARGDPAAALAEVDRETDPGFRAAARVYVLDALGRTTEANSELAQVQATHGPAADYDLAIVFACRNDSTRAIDLLESAYRRHNPALVDLKNELCMSHLDSDPRYKALLRKMNLPE